MNGSARAGRRLATAIGLAAFVSACSYDASLDVFAPGEHDDASSDGTSTDGAGDAPSDVVGPDSTIDAGDAGDARFDADGSRADADAGVDADASVDTDAGVDASSDAPDGSSDAPDDTPDVADAPPGPDAAPDAGDAGCVVPPFTRGVSTLAGCEVSAIVDGNRDVARFANPVNVAIGPGGDVYVADFDNDRIRVVDSVGNVSTLVRQAGFRRPFGLAFAQSGTLYVATDDDDLGHHSLRSGTIWRVDIGTGIATVVARAIGRPRGMIVLPSPDNRIVAADYQHHVIEFIDPNNGTVTVFAGAFDQPGWVDAVGGAARFSTPYGMVLLPSGHVAVADYDNNRIRDVALDGTTTTLAGTGSAGTNDGPVAAATFTRPQDIAIDSYGDLWIADSGNYVVRRISRGQVTTVVGSGVGGWLDSDVLSAAELYGLEGIDITPNGQTLYIADGNRGAMLPFNRVRVAAIP